MNDTRRLTQTVGDLPVATKALNDVGIDHAGMVAKFATNSSLDWLSLRLSRVASMATMANRPHKSSELRDLMAARLKAARMAYSENAAAFAEQVGVSKQTLYKYEVGKSFPDEFFIVKFSQLTGCPPDWLFLGRITADMPATMAARIAVLAPELVASVSETAVQAEAARRTPAREKA